MAILSMSVTTYARTLSHFIAFGVTLALMLAITAYVAWCVRRRWGTHWQRFGPLYFTILSVPLIMADLTRHVLQDTDVWPPPSSSEYREGCDEETMKCLTVTGVFFTIIFTWLGFLCLFIGTMWNANIMQHLREIRRRWRELRGKSPLPE